MSGMTIDCLGKMYEMEGHLGSFTEGTYRLGQWLTDHAEPVDTGHWQGIKDVPQTKTRELRGVTIVYGVPDSQEQLETDTHPSMPWAERQFQERVAGEPVNPGKTYREWPWYRGNVETHRNVGSGPSVPDSGVMPGLEEPKFSHTYMERYWPQQAGEPFVDDVDMAAESKYNRGIRYRYGDLNDVVDLLAREPYTRQAYLPVWFPEDTGAHHGGRVPCSLGYHFMLRNGQLHCAYFIRSCDFLRHFRDDVYMTARLVQWVAEKARTASCWASTEAAGVWDNNGQGPVKPGELTMFMHSLHIFEGDMPKMERDFGAVSSTD